ncbi:MAG: energy-coupling factor transporter ATPase [Lachnospiraceae bacterium]|nr:energy-coupling factor transporter ATPase [Lachnospiraceae bacterium]
MAFIFDHVSYTYQPGTTYAVDALSDISFQIKDGDSVGIIGHTGSGKSTLIQHMNGLLLPTKGAVYYDGQDISDKDFNKSALRSEVGMVFQYPETQLFEETVIKDVCFGPKNQGLSEKEAMLRAYEALKLVNFPDDSFDQSPFSLSGGEQRRAAIAGVLAMKPKTLILDEPCAGLDPAGRNELLTLIRRMNEDEGITIILVSHSMEDIAETVKRVIVMDEGRIFMDGDPHYVFSHEEELLKVSLSVPPVTRLMDRLMKNGFFRERKMPDGYTVTTAREACELICSEISR